MIKNFLLLMTGCLISFHIAKAQSLPMENPVTSPNLSGPKDIGNGNRPSAAPAKYTIALVFHIIKTKDRFFNPTPNQIKEAVKQINKIYRGDSEEFKKYIALGKVPKAFQNAWADTEIDFCLAHEDEKGNFTSGIVFVDRSEKANQKFNLIKTEEGGSTPWNPKYYMNVYILDTYLYKELYYKEGVGGNNAYFGVVINGYVDPKIIAHELGHHFGLGHTFDGGVNKDKICKDGDLIKDTPKQEASTADLAKAKYGIDLVKPGDKWGSCEADGNNYYNMMDYSSIKCMFTKGQRDSLHRYLEEKRPNLGFYGACNPGICQNDNYEPNGSFADAKLVDPLKAEKFGKAVTLGHYFGILCPSSNDVDHFKFKGIKDKKIMVKLYDKMFYDFDLELYKKEGEDYKLVKGSYNKGLVTEYIFIDQNQTGNEEYFVKIFSKDPKATSNDLLADYKYHLYISNNLTKEVESNKNNCGQEPDDNTMAKAIPLPIGTEVKGKICYAGDVDYYTFYLAAPLSLVKLQFSFNEDSPLTQEIVYNSEGKSIQPEFEGNLLEEGFYYIEIKGATKKDFSPTGTYGIQVDVDLAGALESYTDLQYYCPGYNGEPNNSFFDGEWLIEEDFLGGTNYDAICVAGDQDYFKIKTLKTQDLELIIYHENGKFGGNDLLPHLFNLTLYDENQKVVSETYSYINGYLPVKKNYKGLKPGLYYVLVEGLDEEEYSSDYGYKIDATLVDAGKKVDNDLPITLYPNPSKSKEEVTLNIGNILPNKNNKVKIMIKDQYGKVYKQEEHLVEDKIVKNINIIGLPIGTYFISVEGSNTSYTTRMVVE